MIAAYAQPKLQRTWLRQGDKRREILSLDRVKSALGAKTPSPLNYSLARRERVQ